MAEDGLAVFGSPPAFPEPLHVGCPNIPERGRLLERIADLLDRRWLTNDGPYVRELERRIAARVGVAHCVAVCNGTIALELAVRALGLRGEVVVPSLTFVGTVHALAWQGIRPVFADVDPKTHTLDPAAVERAVTRETTGIMGVHLWGRPCDVDALGAIARGRGLRLLFDAAHAFGGARRGTPIGGFGDAEVFSFHATKVANAFEGAVVVTGDEELARGLRRLRNFGFDGYDRVSGLGTNGKMSEVSAAMALGSIEDLDAFFAANVRNHARYDEDLRGVPGVSLLAADPRDAWNHHYAVLEIDEAAAGIGRDDLLDVLWAENVRARRYFYPGCHRMEPYRTTDPEAGRRLPVTQAVVERVLQLPTGTAVTPEQASRVAAIVRAAIAHAPRLRRALAQRREAGARFYGEGR